MFSGRQLYRVRVGSGTQLYKLTDEGAVLSGQPRVNAVGLATPWWFLFESQQILLPGGSMTVSGIADAVELSQRTGASIADFLRSRAAVNLAWNNPMTHLLLVELTRPVVGLMGQASAQLRSEDHANVAFLGGGMQFYLPGLTVSDLAVHTIGKI